MLKVLEDEHFFYTLFFNEEDGGYYLEATCGTVAVFTITVRFTADEAAKYQTDPSFAREFADRIVYSPGAYIDRKVELPA